VNETRATISKAAAIGKPRRPLVVEYEPSEGRSAIATLEADQTRPYKIAASVFRYSGFTLTQTKRAGNVAIYKQAKGKQSPAFEVVIIRKAEAWTAFGREFPATEY